MRQQKSDCQKCQKFVRLTVTHIENDSVLWFARTGDFLKVALTQRDESISFHCAAAQQTVVHWRQMTTIKAGGLLGTELE